MDAPIIGNIERGMGSNLRPANAELHLLTERAARLAPYDSRAWLMLAANNAKPGQQPDKALAQIEMSYYTAPNDIRLMPFRIQIAALSSAIIDDELQSLLENDLRTIVLSHPELKQSIAVAYRGASPAGRRFLEAKLADLNAGFLAELQGTKP
jgi:hypothetical protein